MSTLKPQPKALICKAFPPIYLKTNVVYQLGRAKNNSIVLQNDLVSKHHASVQMNSQGEAILQDLNSRNGTLLNGYRISEPMVLALGDIITIGTFQIFYREVTDTEADRLPAKMNRDQHTQAISTYTDMSGMVGNLNQIGLVELFRTLEHHKKTGILNILPSQGEGYVEFYEGDVRRCHFKTYQALPAVFQLLQETEGFFRFVSKEISPENPEIRLTTEQVLFEYSRYLDEDLSSK